MNRRGFACFVVMLATISVAQKTTRPGEDPLKHVYTISGEVRDAGRLFVNSDINKWLVDNAELLKGRDGRHLTVKCNVDPDRHTLHVLSVDPEVEARGVRLDDSAFRR